MIHDPDGPIADLDAGESFPPPESIRADGLAAVGGDLSPTRLIEAYSLGFFPWSGPGEPILWWNPDPRLVLDPSALRVSRSLRRTLRKGGYLTTYDRNFPDVMRACALTPRRGEVGSWITPRVLLGYMNLHQLGLAHSVETWHEGELVGGLYGVLLGRCFFGESMFSTRTDASKVALVALGSKLQALGVEMIDGQVESPHLISLGGVPIPRVEFLRRLREALESPTDRSTWGLETERGGEPS
ncbi:MAG: leucyl/phenylalanyl-tRNA--protein transferase [Isosphaeraceae bacterium]